MWPHPYRRRGYNLKHDRAHCRFHLHFGHAPAGRLAILVRPSPEGLVDLWRAYGTLYAGDAVAWVEEGSNSSQVDIVVRRVVPGMEADAVRVEVVNRWTPGPGRRRPDSRFYVEVRGPGGDGEPRWFRARRSAPGAVGLISQLEYRFLVPASADGVLPEHATPWRTGHEWGGTVVRFDGALDAEGQGVIWPAGPEGETDPDAAGSADARVICEARMTLAAAGMPEAEAGGAPVLIWKRYWPEARADEAAVVRFAKSADGDDWTVRMSEGDLWSVRMVFSPGRRAAYERQRADGPVPPSLPEGMTAAIAEARAIAARPPFSAPFPWAVRDAWRADGRLMVSLSARPGPEVWLDRLARLTVEFTDEVTPRLLSVVREVQHQIDGFLKIPEDILSLHQALAFAERHLAEHYLETAGETARLESIRLTTRAPHLNRHTAIREGIDPDRHQWAWAASYLPFELVHEPYVGSPSWFEVVLDAVSGDYIGQKKPGPLIITRGIPDVPIVPLKPDEIPGLLESTRPPDVE